MRILFALFAVATLLSSNMEGGVTKVFTETEVLEQYRGERTMEGTTEWRNLSGKIRVETELLDRMTFRYRVLEVQGSKRVTDKLLDYLKNEEEEVSKGENDKYALTEDNYFFSELEEGKLEARPKHRTKFLISGFIFTNPEGLLVESQGKYVRNPSFLVRNATMRTKYRHLSGVRVPESSFYTADLLFIGKSTLKTEFHWDEVNWVETPR